MPKVKNDPPPAPRVYRRATDRLFADECAEMMGWRGKGRSANWTKGLGTARGRPEHDGIEQTGLRRRWWYRSTVRDFAKTATAGRPGRPSGPQCKEAVPNATGSGFRNCRRALPCPDHEVIQVPKRGRRAGR